MKRKTKKPSSKTTEAKDLEIFLELGNIGAGHAATSLSEILQQRVEIDIPRIGAIPPNMLPKFYQTSNMPATAVYIHLMGEMECHFLFIFELPELKEITNLMTKAITNQECESSMESSAIEELGNILIGSFLTAISDFTGLNLISTPPMLIGSPFDSIISEFMVKLASDSGDALVFDTCFKREGGYYAPTQLMILPSPELRKLLIRKSNEVFEDSESGNVELICAENLAEAENVPKAKKTKRVKR